MQVVIEIPDDLYKSIICHRCKVAFQQKCDYEDLKNAIEDGTPLLKGHGRLIDADAVDTRYSDPEVIEALNEAPTIIEADKEE